MSKSIHQWQTFYSPRNGSVSIQACKVCGIAKGIVSSSYACKLRTKKSSLLKGWSTIKPSELKKQVSV